MAFSLPILGIGSGCGSRDPEIVFRELVAALHLYIVPSTLGFAPECQVPLVFLVYVAHAAMRSLDALGTRSLRAASPTHVWIHAGALG